MLWITRSRVHVDRVACPWLIARFIDSEAEFLFVPDSEVRRRSEETGGIPFDSTGAEFGHKEGRCSFETLVQKFGIKDPAIARMAKIVHAADVGEDRGKDEIAPGLDAIARGFGIVFPDDASNIEAQFGVYDALYAWCRLEVAAGRP